MFAITFLGEFPGNVVQVQLKAAFGRLKPKIRTRKERSAKQRDTIQPSHGMTSSECGVCMLDPKDLSQVMRNPEQTC